MKKPGQSLATVLMIAKALRDPEIQPTAVQKKAFAKKLANLESPEAQNAVLMLLRAVGKRRPSEATTAAMPADDAVTERGKTGTGKPN